uniref:Alliinase n=1 Tax=Allium macrostemon TaxID=91198 RepID=A0A3G2I875_9ASPA|nr:alliinase [Allium macrostemon]
METHKPGNKMPLLLTMLCISSSFLTTVQPLDWALEAATEAERVAATECSNHGRAFLDGSLSEGSPKCECNTCYEGPDCSKLTPDCSADVASGDALFLEEYWKQHKKNTAVLVSGWHRMSYFFTPHNNFMSNELNKTIREVHDLVGNVETTGKKLVFGVGVTQLIHGLIFTMSRDAHVSKPYKVVARVPYYPVFKNQTVYFDNQHYEWEGNANNHVNENPKEFIEMVTSPNNPDGELITSEVIKGAKVIYDMVYYWPHYTPIKFKADYDIMLFTMSKFTGHSGSRFGWVWLKDDDLYDKMLGFLVKNTEGTSREAQLRTLKILKEVTARIKSDKGKPGDINTFAYLHLQRRWKSITSLLDQSDRFSYQQLPAIENCNYFRKKRSPSPAYAWVKCNWEREDNCSKVFEDGKIKTQDGLSFEADNRYVRISLIKTDDDFDQMMYYLTKMVDETMPPTTPPVTMEISTEVDERNRRPFI